MAKTYEVQFVYEKGSIGTELYTGNKRMCNAYVRQAIQKGQNPERLKIVEIKQPRSKE